MMQIFPVKISSPRPSALVSTSGLTLVEILAVVALLGILTTMGVQMLGKKDSKDLLSQTKEQMERVMNVASNEAMVRNRMVRLRFDLSKSPVSYQLAVSSSPELLPPSSSTEDQNSFLSSEGQEAKRKEEEEFNGYFTDLAFQQLEDELEIDVKLAALAHAQDKSPGKTEGSADLFFFPTSERSQALLVFITLQETMTLEVQPVREELIDQYQLTPASINLDLPESYRDFSLKIIREWKQRP